MANLSKFSPFFSKRLHTFVNNCCRHSAKSDHKLHKHILYILIYKKTIQIIFKLISLPGMDVCRALAYSLPEEVRQEVGAGKDSKKILQDDIFEF